MNKTTLILPMQSDDEQLNEYKKLNKKFKMSLIENEFSNLDEFFAANNIHNEQFYVDVISAGIVRPRIFFKRSPSEVFINSFNPFILNVLNSNIDIQFVIDEFSCATYCVEYVNKSDRGISDLQRKIIQLQDSNPEFDFSDIATKLSIDLLNSVQVSAQEAAGFLLRFPMSHSSVKIEYIKTVWPNERTHVRKPTHQLENPEIEDDSTNIWQENSIEKYEKRPSSLDNATVAHFVSNYTFSPSKKMWQLRMKPRVLRYRNYSSV